MHVSLAQTLFIRLFRPSLSFFLLLTLILPLPLYSQVQGGLDAQTAKKILVVGDSLSAAYKLNADQGWVSLLQQRLTRQGYSLDIVNASVSGATTDAGLRIMPNALSTHSPSIVLIELGGNDGLQGKPVAHVTKNLERLIMMAKQNQAQVVLIGTRLPPNLGKRYVEPFFEQYSLLAVKHELPLVPFLLDNVAGRTELMMSDGLHPNAKGQITMLENVWPVLLPLISQVTKP